MTQFYKVLVWFCVAMIFIIYIIPVADDLWFHYFKSNSARVCFYEDGKVVDGKPYAKWNWRNGNFTLGTKCLE